MSREGLSQGHLTLPPSRLNLRHSAQHVYLPNPLAQSLFQKHQRRL